MRNFLFLLVSLMSYLIVLPSYAVEFCNIPYSEPIEGEFAEVGQAVDSDRERFKVLNAFKGQKTEVGSGIATLSASLLTEYEEVFKKVNKNKQGSIKVSFFEFGKSRSFTKTVLNQKYTATFVVVFETTVSNGKWEVDTNNGSPLTEYAKSFLSTPCGFKKLFGDSFIFQTRRGAQVYVAINVSFGSNAQYEDFNKGMGTGEDGMGKTVKTKLSDWVSNLPDKIGNIELGGAFKVGSGKVSKSTLENGRVDIIAMQVGGDTTRLGQIFGAGGDVGTASCRLSALVDDAGKSTNDPTLTNCSKSFYGALAYLAQEEFATGVKQYPIVLDYLSRSYWEVEPSIQLVKELTSSIETVREQLAQESLKRETDLSTVKDLLSESSLTAAHRQELTALQPKLEQDIQKLTMAGFTCFSDLASCESIATQTLGSLAVYDQAILKLYLEDGLIANYSCDGNMQDKSGHGNDAVVNKVVTYVEGKSGQAAKFTDGYAEVPNTKDFAFNNQSITFSAWTTIAHNYKYVYIPFISLGRADGDWIHLGKNRGGLANSGVFMEIVGKATTNSIENGEELLRKYQNSWLHVVGVIDYENRVAKLYLNGQLQDTAELRDSFRVASEAKLRIGYSVDELDGKIYYGYQSGLMDDVRIYNRAITDAEIQLLYTGDTVPPTYHLSVNKTGDGNVTGAGDYEANSSVTLTAAVANANSQFIGWSGDCSGTANSTTLLMNADKTCIASFTAKSCDNSNPFLTSCPPPPPPRCTASYQNNTLIIPCLNIANLFTTETYQVELKQQLFSMTFNVNMESLQSKSMVKDACAAEYKGANGEVHVPCVEITGTSDMYDVYLQQQPSTLLFDLDMKRLVKTK